MDRGKRYNEDFKKMIVELYNNQNKPTYEIVREYGISNSALYKWVKDYSPIKSENGEITNNKENSYKIANQKLDIEIKRVYYESKKDMVPLK